jgi:hypothetical protein
VNIELNEARKGRELISQESKAFEKEKTSTINQHIELFSWYILYTAILTLVA